ncbi:MAG: ZIP family metal transporter [Patescibacteria group bacterium]|jgi:zinc and cadmium transporter|nr:ZIP family metal transporter [Patescibacteria group bacterium]
MTTLLWIIGATVVVSLLSLVGILALYLNDNLFKKIVKPVVALSAGALLGGAFLHIIPEVTESFGNGMELYLWILFGFSLFLFLEQFIHWHHCHRSASEHHAPVTYLILVADGLHNLIDGLAIGAAFVVDVRLGIITTVVMMFHEIPQELGDFGVLVNGGWSKRKALLFNFGSGLMAVLGGLIAFLISKELNINFLLAMTAGTFIYIASSDLIPEIKGGKNFFKNLIHFLVFLAGIGMMLIFKLLFE